MIKHAPRDRPRAWRWDRHEPIPDADVVVCAPEMLARCDYGQYFAMRDHGEKRRAAFVVPTSAPLQTFVCADNVNLPSWMIPALYLRWFSDLARLPDLLAVRSRQRAIVVDPVEGLNVHPVLCKYAPSKPEHRYGPWCSPADVVDFVVVSGFWGPLNPEHVADVVKQCREASMRVAAGDDDEVVDG